MLEVFTTFWFLKKNYNKKLHDFESTVSADYDAYLSEYLVAVKKYKQ